MLNQKKIELQIWDTMGQEQYMSLTNSYFAQSMGVLLVYDITRKSSIEAIQMWLDQIRMHCDENIVIFVVGNKNDLQNLRISTNNEISKNFSYVYCTELSALSNEGVDSCFIKLAIDIQMQQALARNDNYDSSNRPSVRLSTKRNDNEQTDPESIINNCFC